MYHFDSYQKHENWYNVQFPSTAEKTEYLSRNDINRATVNSWLQHIFFSCIDPLLETRNQNWLTVGDAYGFDAQYIKQKGGQRVMASDLNGEFLQLALEAGIIDHYAVQNAENLTFRDNTFDYILCKETYHHFPRPYAALYEMVRVSTKGIMLMEPQDPVSTMPLLLGLVNMLKVTLPGLIRGIWKNRFSYEPVGNFVYKISEREFEKFAAGLALPAIAFKQINPNFYNKSYKNLDSSSTNKEVRKIKFKKGLLDLLTRLRLIPGQVLVVIVFKIAPNAAVMASLKKEGYRIVQIPVNPYV